MTPIPTPLTLPSEIAVVTTLLENLDSKLDSLQPLLALLEPQERSDLGAALISALHKITDEANRLQALREQQEMLIPPLTELAAATGTLQNQITNLQHQNTALVKMIREMYAQLMLPID